MLELNNSTIKDAIVGVTIGKKIAGGIDLTTTGGIIQSTASNFYNNQIGVDMYPYASYKRGNRKPDISFFIESSFTIDDYYKGVGVTQAPYAFIRTEDVYGLNVLGCNFTGDDYMVGIYALNSRIIVKDYCANPISPTNCGSTPTQNVFSKLGKAIYLINTISTNYSTIDHALFHNTNYKNNAQIYVNKVNNVELINNGMDVDGSNLITQPNYGIYLNNCDAYIVENNVFQASPALKNVGIYVNNSGPNANSIYNNTFTELAQGLWAVNQNYDPTTGNGLVMNCNDFLYGKYNIGIQRTSRNVAGYPNNTGVNTTQGIANTPNEPDNVRNTYNVNACNTNAENKYYIATSNAFFISSHGSFQGGIYHPTPQISSSCSNSLELVDIVGSNPPLSSIKSTYCPVNNLGGFSSLMLASSLSTNRSNASTTSASITAQLDGGNTQTLLNAINGNTSPGNLKNMLMAPAYLSDAVLLAYFGKANTPPNGHIKDVFEKNAPTTNTVWQLVQSLNLPNGIFNQIQAAQNQNKLSNRANMQSQLQLAQREIGLLNNQKIRRFINDTAGVQYDSIIAIYNLNELPNSKFDKVAINIAAKRFAVAQNQIKELTPQYPDFCAVQQYALNLAQNANYIKDMKLNPSAKNYLIAEVNKANYLTEGLAASILAQVYNIRFDEERLEPIQTKEGARLLNNQTTTNNDVISLANGINVYPNPANDMLNVSFDNQTQNTYTIKIVDVTAKVLIEQNCNSTCTIKLNTLQNGIYFVNLYNGNALLSTKKIVVIK